MKKLVTELILRVYDDGSYEIKRVLKTDKTDLPERIREASSRTTQAIMVILKMYHMKRKIEETEDANNIDYTKLYNKAIQETAQDLELRISTVRDKLERQMGQSAGNIVKLIKNFLLHKDMTLKEELLKSIKGTLKEDKDKAAIEELFRYIEVTS